jgi:hypothetical protein
MPHRDSARAAVAWAAIDTLFCLLLIILVLLQPPPKKTTAVDTLGVYAVTISWKDGSNDDVDLYVEDPEGNVVYFGSDSVGLMHLEHDDLGTAASETEGSVRVVQNGERVVIRGAVVGEYSVNVHLYMKSDRGSIKVHVELWRLRGNDKSLISRNVVLVREGQALTPFRFTLDAKGRMTGHNELPKNVVYSADPSAGVSYDSSGGNGTRAPDYYGGGAP